ncbi:unnamed protein product [Meloidogyne enterolobii]|uniref:Uncharacterized protein n=1 Tax=Meloidogyne enterolobii TaxID=390850 RepID=A0ACB1B8Z9_MELEN
MIEKDKKYITFLYTTFTSQKKNVIFVTFYFHSTTNSTRKRRELIPECCPGWIHLEGEDGCLRANCTPQLCENGGVCLSENELEGNFNNKLCQCPTGFDGSTCQFDVNECLAGNGGCEHECVNIVGSFYCKCYSGFELAENGVNCIDVDECSISNGGCQFKCINTKGGYLCQCPFPMQLAPNGRDCIKENSCKNQNGGCEQICEERTSDSSFWRCRCRKGYKLGEDRKSCFVENPCSMEENRCQHFCLNAGNGKAKCQCYPGFKLAEDQFSCVDINECIENESPLCSFNCENTYGNYYCVCPEGYQLGEDGYSCEPNRLASPFIFAKQQQFTIDSLPPLFEKTEQQQKSLQPERLKIRGIAQHYETKQHSILPILNNNKEKEAEMSISTACTFGRFGPDCEYSCSDCKNGGGCNYLRNKCECMPGWQGQLCELPCLEGTFGIECSQYCQCGGANCNSITGECLCLNGTTKCEDENCLKGLFLNKFSRKNGVKGLIF